MNRSLRVAVADDEPRMRDYYSEILTLMGHQILCASRTGRELVRDCRDERPDLIITDIRMPDMDGIDAASEICRGEPIPVILVSAYYDADLLERISDNYILAYLIKPIKRADLEASVALVRQRFNQFQALRKEAGELRQAMEDRKLIERAKGILMKKAGLDEPEAFRRLQKEARDHNQKIADVARIILRADSVLQPPDAGRP